MNITITINDDPRTIEVTRQGVTVEAPASELRSAELPKVDFEPVWQRLAEEQDRTNSVPMRDVAGRARAEGRMAGMVEVFSMMAGIPPATIITTVLERLEGPGYMGIGVVQSEPETPPAADLDAPPAPPKEGIVERTRREMRERGELIDVDPPFDLGAPGSD